MVEKQATKKSTRAKAKRISSQDAGFTAEEKAAMKERVREMKAAASKEDGERAVLDKIAEMPKADRAMAERVHAVITSTAPELVPRTWYGMPAYAKDGDIICFFQNSQKFKVRYGTLGFSDKANLDEGDMWPTGYALMEMTPEVEARIAELVKQAVS